MSTKYAVVYRRGVAHIQGLEEKTTGSEMSYALSACPALSRSAQWATYQAGDDLETILKAAQSFSGGACARCTARAAELLAEQALEAAEAPVDATTEHENDPFNLRELGYSGPIDRDGYVAREEGDRDSGSIPPHKAPELTRRVVELLDGVKLGASSAQRFYVATFEGNTLAQVKYRETREALEQTLRMDGIVGDAGVVPFYGESPVGQRSRTRYMWGPVPPREQLQVLPTVASVKAFPDFWISGPGRAVAELTPCPHGYHLTDSCPGCDSGDEKRAELLDAVVGPTSAEKEYAAARGELASRAAARRKAEEGLENQVWLARNQTDTALKANVQQLKNDVLVKGALRAIQLHAKEAARLDVSLRVWQHAVDYGRTSGSWTDALVAAREYALRALRDQATVRTRNRVDAALAQVAVDALSDLIDAMDAMLRKVREPGQ